MMEDILFNKNSNDIDMISLKMSWFLKRFEGILKAYNG